jgi:proton-dependent oligopeptide transporter, POT family
VSTSRESSGKTVTDQHERAARRLRHPAGLYVLFFTELWERYSFYALMALLTLYMDEGLHLRQSSVAQIYGAFVGASFFMPLVGGVVADRWLGFFRTVVLGAVLMAIGQLMLVPGRTWLFFAGLAMLASGTGMLKANVSTIVGNLYRDRPQLRDAGFNIFYMGINIGAFVAPIAVSWLRARYGWSAAFLSAAVAMLFAVGIFVGFRRHLTEGLVQQSASETRDEANRGAVDDRARIVALLVVFTIVIAFWVAFYQNGFTLTLWARDHTATSVAPEAFQSVEPLAVILFSPLLVLVWAGLRRRGAEPSTIGKIVVGMLFTAASFAVMTGAGIAGGDAGRVSTWWLIWSYLLIAVGEICLSPMGLSLVTRVAPARLRATMMGAWFVATGTGGYLSGFVGVYWNTVSHSRFFLLVAVLAAAAAVVMTIAKRALNRVFEAE